MSNPTLVLPRTTTNEFQSSLKLQTARPSAKSIVPQHTAEARYWAERYGLGSSVSGGTTVRKIDFRAGTSSLVHQLAFGPMALSVVCGPRVSLYGTTNQSQFHRHLNQKSHSTSPMTLTELSVDRQISTNGQLALAAAYRSDERLVAVGTHQGRILVSDATTRATLATFVGPELPVRKVGWFRNGSDVWGAGDDGNLRVWKLGEEQALLQLGGHGDAVRSAALWETPKNIEKPYTLGFTGSYDHTIRVWNLENREEAIEDRCLSVLNHGSPVQALLTMRSTNPDVPVWLLSAGGTHIKVWNPVSGRCIHQIEAQHRKTITTLTRLIRRNPEEETIYDRVATAGLDGLIRIHAWNSTTGSLQQVHGVPLYKGITALTQDKDRIAIGFVDGHVSVRRKSPVVISKKRTRDPPAGTYSFFTRGMNADPTQGDFVVQASSKKKKLRKFDVALKQFRYGDALDEALETRIPQVVVAVLEELGKRRGLTIALSNRDEESLEPILSFTARYIARPRFSALLVGVANKLLDIYGDVTGESEVIDELFVKLKNQVSQECQAQKVLLHIVGQLDSLSNSQI